MSESSPPTRSVFLSYAREDGEAARGIANALRAAGVEVWFDENELRGGDAWDAKIRRQIDACHLFIPIISRHTQERNKGYFRLEWKLAVDQTHLLADGVPFVAPVVIDETREAGALVPPEFMRVQWMRLPAGQPTAAFIEQIHRLLAPPGTAHAGETRGTRSPFEAASAPTRASARRGRGRGVAVAVLVAVGVIAGVVFWRKSREGASAPVANVAPVASATAPVARELPRDKSIAVLPFTNMSEEKDSAFFTDGIHEDVLTNLALIREFRVVSRTSVMGYRETGKSVKQIAQELGVTYILEGSVRRSGNKVRVTGQLIHAATDEHVWAEKYDRDLTDIFGIQSELSQQIASALKIALSPEEKVLIARKPTNNAAAYDLFLRARDVLNREGLTYPTRVRQIELLQQAVDLDPEFAQAWAELGAACAYWYFASFDDMDRQLERAKRAIDRAMALAPDDPDVFGNLGTYYYYGFRDYARAAEQYERRARLQPNSPVIFNSLALIQRRQGQWVQSLANARRASELDPANLGYQRNLLATLRAARRWDEAIATQRRIATLAPSLDERFALAYLAFQASGSHREAEAFFAGLSEEEKKLPLTRYYRMVWARGTGNYAEAIRLDREHPNYDELGLPPWMQAFHSATVLFASGDLEAARARIAGQSERLRELVQREPNNLRYWSTLAGMVAIEGDLAEARRLAAKTEEILPESRDALDGVTFAVYRATLADWSGDTERALAEYQRLLQVPSIGIISVAELGAGYSRLRGDPRFEAMLKDPKNNAPLF